MDNFIAARSQMGMSLAFHIIFAAIGVSLPLIQQNPNAQSAS
jgi:cytochrome d ubiquinol oxidase subunit I